jgi:hypothetical protein
MFLEKKININLIKKFSLYFKQNANIDMVNASNLGMTVNRF